jgi:serine/threonine protein kinase
MNSSSFIGGNVEEPKETAVVTPHIRIESLDLFELYSNVKRIAKGSFGVIFIGIRPKDQQVVAIKVIPISSTTVNNPLNEIELAQRIACNSDESIHECAVMPIYNAWVNEKLSKLYLEMKYIQGGTALNIINRDIEIPEYLDFVQQNMKSLISTLLRIHNLCVLHRDIKPENLLFESATERLYFADYGLSCVVPCKEESYLIGSIPYLDPTSYQFVKPLQLNESSDVYALGIVLYELLLRTRYEDYQDIDADYPTPAQINKAYLDALKNLKQELKLINAKYSIIVDIVAKMIHPFIQELRPTLESIVIALQDNDIDKLKFDFNNQNTTCI